MSIDLQQLKTRFGGVIECGGTRWRGPSPGHSPHDRSCTVIIGDDGEPKVQSFTEDWRVCRDHLGLGRGSPQIGGCSPTARSANLPTCSDARALAIWREARPGGEVVGAYLKHREISLPCPPSLRQGTDLLYGRTPRPMMVAGVQAGDRRLIAVHRTFLTWSGRKSTIGEIRKGLGAYRDGAVRLGAAEDVLGLSEGIETGLAAQQLSGFPVWAALGARLAAVGIPAVVRELHIFADNDAPGQKAASEAAERHSRRGIKVVIRTPADEFGDWNDVLHARSREAA